MFSGGGRGECSIVGDGGAYKQVEVVAMVVVVEVVVMAWWRRSRW